jgi:hypothetical protein
MHFATALARNTSQVHGAEQVDSADERFFCPVDKHH